MFKSKRSFGDRNKMEKKIKIILDYKKKKYRNIGVINEI